MKANRNLFTYFHSTATEKPNSPVPCTDNWLNITIFIVAIIGAFLTGGIFSIVFVFALKKALNKKGRHFTI
jgi:hypothetical protein